MKIHMFLFLRLALAHFIGDFLFQSDEVYEKKKKGFQGALVHYFIIFLTFILFSLPYLKYFGCWLVIIFASFTHVIQDEIKLRALTAPKLNFFAFIADQVLHIVFLLPIFLFSFAKNIPVESHFIIKMYNNDSLIIFGIAYIVSIFMGAYLWESFKVSFFKKKPDFEKSAIKYGMFERFIITTGFLGFSYLVFLLIPLGVRFFFRKKLPFSSNFMFNLFFSGLIGIYLVRFLPIF